MHFLRTLPALIAFFGSQVFGSQWIDPHTMDIKQKNKLNDIVIHKPDLNPDDYCLNFKGQNSCESDLYFKRMLRLLLSNAHFVLSDDDSAYKAFINFHLSSTDFDFLQEFSLNEKSDFTKYSEIGAILETAFQRTIHEEYAESVLSLLERICELMSKPAFLTLLCSLLVLLVWYNLLRANWSWFSITKYFIFLAYLCDCAMTYLHLLEAEEIENMVNLKTYGAVPTECDPKNMKWYHYLWSSNENCKKYYQATHQNVKYIVTPIKVFHYQLGYFIVEPLKYLGTGMGHFATSMYQTVPWGLGIILFPIMILIPCVLFCIILVFITNTPVKINLFHLLKFELGCHTAPVQDSGSSRQAVQGSQRSDTVQHIVYVTQAQKNSMVDHVPEADTPPRVSIKDKNSDKEKDVDKQVASCSSSSESQTDVTAQDQIVTVTSKTPLDDNQDISET